MIVIGVDLSLAATGVAFADGSTSTVRGSSLAGMLRLQELRDMVLASVETPLTGAGPDLVVIEGYSYSSAHSHAHGLGELGGVVRLALWEAGIAYIDLPPACVKKLATGKGNAGKPEVFAAAIRRLGYAGVSHDEADALWCREAALQHYGCSTVTLPAAHLDALAKVAWPALSGLDAAAAI